MYSSRAVKVRPSSSKVVANSSQSLELRSLEVRENSACCKAGDSDRERLAILEKYMSCFFGTIHKYVLYTVAVLFVDVNSMSRANKPYHMLVM